MSKPRKWKYILLVGEGSYFADSLWELVMEMLSHRFKHWKRGDGWMD